MHVASKGSYIFIFFLLLGLTGLTVYCAFIDFGFLNTPIALAIAMGKGALVVLFFMHLRHSPALVVLFAGASIVWLGIMFSLTLADYLSRADAVGW
jgi:cytochrome c oxidase subunit IV